MNAWIRGHGETRLPILGHFQPGFFHEPSTFRNILTFCENDGIKFISVVLHYQPGYLKKPK